MTNVKLEPNEVLKLVITRNEKGAIEDSSISIESAQDALFVLKTIKRLEKEVLTVE